MAKLAIKVGAPEKQVEMETVPFLPGLCMHRSPGALKTDNSWNITHTESGLGIVLAAPEEDLELVRMILGRLLWDIPAWDIYEDKRYYDLIQEVLLVVRTSSSRQEERIADDIEGARQPASGSRWGYKRDVITPSVLVEAKTTKSIRHTVQVKDLEHLQMQAYMSGRIPAYVVELENGREEVVLLPAEELDPKPKETIHATKQNSVTISTLLLSKRSLPLVIVTDAGEWALVDYVAFLSVAKRGVDK